MRPRINDRDRTARAASKQLDPIAFRFIAKRRQSDHFRKQPDEALVIGVEIETVPFDRMLFEPAREGAQSRAFPHVPPGLNGDDEPMTKGFQG